MSFLPGLRLNAQFYRDVVSPLLERSYPHLRYSAALMGYGSDVLGYDNSTSMDHNWGPRMQLFLSPEDIGRYGTELDEYLRNTLPFRYKGFPTNFCPPRYDKTRSMLETSSYPVNHLIEIVTVGAYLRRYLGVESVEELTVEAWLTVDDQKLLEITSGEVFSDGLGELERIRRSLEFFPHEVLLYRMARLWKRIEEDEPLIGRSIELNEPMATKIIAARLVENCIKLCLYQERRYLPYPKWLVRSFEDTGSSAEIGPLCEKVLSENDPQSIESGLAALYQRVVETHNRYEGLPKLNNRVRNFFNRPYKVIFAETIVEALKHSISNPTIAARL